MQKGARFAPSEVFETEQTDVSHSRQKRPDIQNGWHVDVFQFRLVVFVNKFQGIHEVFFHCKDIVWSLLFVNVEIKLVYFLEIEVGIFTIVCLSFSLAVSS